MEISKNVTTNCPFWVISAYIHIIVAILAILYIIVNQTGPYLDNL